ncbi:uncharacterized protein [Anabrus simplex]|uniref:uncharacterized protein isoform X1 n=1 Tax=Anabrus simplex TaxID=316456 RepID=UPI0035A2CD16
MASTQRSLLLLSAVVLVVVLLAATAQAAEEPKSPTQASEKSKSAFGQAFAEVVVESSLRVNPKGGGRQSRNRKLEVEADSSSSTSTSAPLVRSKRQRPPYFWRS